MTEKQMLEKAVELLKKATPRHDSTCWGYCMDGEPEKCLTVAFIKEINKFIKEANQVIKLKKSGILPKKKK